MKKFFNGLTAAALAVSLSGCTSYASAASGETYEGTITLLSEEYIVIEVDDEEIKVPVSDDTTYTKDSGMGGGMEMSGTDGAAGGGGDVPEMPSGESGESTDSTSADSSQTPPDLPEGESADTTSTDTSGEPPELPEGESGAEPVSDSSDTSIESSDSSTDTESAGEAPAEDAGQSTEMTSTATIQDLNLGDNVTVVMDDDGNAESITVTTSSDTASSSSNISYTAVYTYTEDTEVSDTELTSTGTDENAVLVATDGITVTLDSVTITRDNDSSTGGDNSSFYGVGASALVTNGTLVVKNSTITGDAAGAAGVFAYGDGVAYVSDTDITTTQDTSGGIHVAGGGTLYAWDLTVETSGESSAAIRSDRGSGTMVVDGGTYTSNGTGSPAVYSTADITINGATLVSNSSEAICIEGLNTIRLFDCDLSGNMQDSDQNDCTWNVILYQSMSGDSEVGNSTFEMVGGTLTAANGGQFYTTNTESTFIISGVDITNAADSEFLLKVTGNSNARGWGSTGSNGADCNFTAIDQVLEGDVIWDTISTLDFYLTDGSSLTGAVVNDESNAGSGGSGYANVYIDSSSTWVVTGDSTLTTLANAGTIVDADGNTVTIVGTDGTVYVSGTSAYTITVSSYTTDVDTSGASTVESFETYEVSQLS